MNIIYGTGNKHKTDQVESFFKAVGIDVKILGINDIGFNEDIMEDGKTFEENSLIKAKVIKNFCKENNISGIIVTDDSGLMVDCLNGKPGVYSGRWASSDGEHKTSQEANIKKLYEEIEKTGDKERKAKFVCILTAVLENEEIKQVRGETLGKIAEKPGTMGKLTYGPVFVPEGFDRVMNDLRPEELGTTHREKAFMELLKIIKEG